MTEAEIDRIGEGFSDLSLPAAEFSHHGHWAAVVWALHRDGPARVAARMPGMIRAFNCAKGGVNTATEGYHETITLASIAAAASRQAGTMAETFAAIVGSEMGRSDWVLQYWRKETLFTAQARACWVAPDLEAFPFRVYHHPVGG